MKCCCNKCKKSMVVDWDDVFISEDGRYLCDKCSIGVAPVDEKVREKLKKYENS